MQQPLPDVRPNTDAARFSHGLTLALVALLCLAAIGNVLYGRLRAPADLYRKDQNKTMAYTVDVVQHGRFSLPRDVLYQPATKPPLYNWLAAAVVGPTGIYDEWAQKWPSVASCLAIAVIVGLWCWRTFSASLGNAHAAMIGFLAAAIWMASKSTVLLLYIARPDMVQALCLIGAWMAGTATLQRGSPRAATKPALWFWLAVTAAALAKGPAAIYAILYVILASKLCYGRWGRLRNFRWPLGLTLLLGSVGLWLFCAYRQDADHVEHVLIGTEVVKRVIASNPEGFVKPVYYSAMWFIAQNPYWSYLSIGVMMAMFAISLRKAFTQPELVPPTSRPSSGGLATYRTFVDDEADPVEEPRESGPRIWRAIRDFFGTPAGMATLWIIVVVACLSIPKDKRMDFLLPSHPAVAILAAYGCVAVLARTTWARYGLPFAAAAFCVWQGRPIKIEAVSSLIHHWMRPALVTPAAYVVLSGAAAVGAVGLSGFLYVSRKVVRLEHVLLACGVLYWSSAMVKGVYRFTGEPGHGNPSVYAARFATASRAAIGKDANVVCIIRSKHPILTLMGLHQGSYLTRADFEKADYVIAELSKFPTLRPIITSGKVPIDYGDIHDTEKSIPEDRVGLFKIDKVRHVPSVAQMISIQRWVGQWTDQNANPYRSKNTVWIDSAGDPPIWTPPPGDPWRTGGSTQPSAQAITQPPIQSTTSPATQPAM